MKTYSYSSETMQRQLEEAKAYLRARGKYVIDKGNNWHFSHTVQWDEYKKLARAAQLQAA
ncbi:MAG: hypothetical protein M3Q00_05885 [Pseudomonadota bacterium]|nr:hypothetical protein [Pseudomonadota bacterium]